MHPPRGMSKAYGYAYGALDGDLTAPNPRTAHRGLAQGARTCIASRLPRPFKWPVTPNAVRSNCAYCRVRSTGTSPARGRGAPVPAGYLRAAMGKEPPDFACNVFIWCVS